MSTPRRRPTTNRLAQAAATCTACPWEAHGANALALAAQHYDRTRHPTATTVTNIISYGNEADTSRALEAAGQEHLDI